MREIDLVLDFAVNLGDRMLDSGANLERVNTSIHRILHTYGFQEISLFSLSSILMVSACDLGGERAYRQLTVRGGSIHLERLKKLNQLVFTVCETKPEPSALHGLLLTNVHVHEYPTVIIILGQMLAGCSLNFLFGGATGDAVCTGLIIFLLFWVQLYLDLEGLNRMAATVLISFFVGCAGILLTAFGPGTDSSSIVTACTLMIIPGIPLVNAVRNLFCGNEMNGILQLMSVLLASLCLALGLTLSYILLGGVLVS
ncbi:MAG: threonine/serine exporter ThrE family protein [Lachnospiraceae bacterium]